MKEVVRVLDIDKEALVEKYLGLPTEVGYATSGVFEYLRAQVRGTIDGWCAGLVLSFFRPRTKLKF